MAVATKLMEDIIISKPAELCSPSEKRLRRYFNKKYFERLFIILGNLKIEFQHKILEIGKNS